MNNPSESDDFREPLPVPPVSEPGTAEPADMTEPADARDEYGPDAPVESPLAPPRKGRTRLFYIVAGVIGTVLVLALLCGAALGFGVFHAWQTSSAVSPVLEQTMQAMQAKDVDQALTQFARPIQGDELRANLQQLIDNPDYYAYFADYERLNVNGVNAGINAGNSADNPPGEYADVTADVTYQDGTHRTLTALLNKLDGQWKMLSIQISDPITPGTTPGETPG